MRWIGFRSGANRAPSSAFRTLGAAPTILEFLWLSESNKALSSDCLVRGKIHLLKRTQPWDKECSDISQTPPIFHVGAEADDWTTLRINIFQTAARDEKLSHKQAINNINDLV